MLTRMKKMLKKEKGFTLVELLAVIAILAIILAIAIPSVGKIISNSEAKAEKANVELIKNAARLADVSDPEKEGDYTVSVADLKSAGFLDSSESDEDELVGFVKVETSTNGVKTYTYSKTKPE
ncbi:prepilin-type N-terminal cleavage/methylation domain-containing protein [Oceanobacillus manasiensis]|uniref:prepilin-type N-terminal cleavage/methylation domain-containing protein n=1 Tax=Oceanobacillus manasiensis TaxID=586413 RepID=UPI0005A8CCB3|nr:prepilin-type N-terminal cleavage/methylation domain-containing protein [Oceanobacillus manasiensis]